MFIANFRYKSVGYSNVVTFGKARRIVNGTLYNNGRFLKNYVIMSGLSANESAFASANEGDGFYTIFNARPFSVFFYFQEDEGLF